MNNKRYYWDEDTIEHFKKIYRISGKYILFDEIDKFVANNCDIEEKETEFDLIADLFKQTTR